MELTPCFILQDPYFMKNHLGSYECKLCLTLHNNEVSSKQTFALPQYITRRFSDLFCLLLCFMDVTIGFLQIYCVLWTWPLIYQGQMESLLVNSGDLEGLNEHHNVEVKRNTLLAAFVL